MRVSCLWGIWGAVQSGERLKWSGGAFGQSNFETVKRSRGEYYTDNNDTQYLERQWQPIHGSKRLQETMLKALQLQLRDENEWAEYPGH